ncbi:UBX domain-containing protein 7-like protein, partial [Dinothrombium tinctorium]
EHPSPNGSTPNPQPERPYLLQNNEEKNPYEESEEMQLKAAIAASLADSSQHNHKSNEATRESNIEFESDEFETFDSDTEDSTFSKNHFKENSKSDTKLENKNKTTDENKKTSDCWKNYLGSSTDKTSELIIRFPDGKREQMSFPADSQLKALLLYVSSNGYDMNEYDLITNFPKRNLKELSSSETLSAVGLFPRETVFVQHKS